MYIHVSAGIRGCASRTNAFSSTWLLSWGYSNWFTSAYSCLVVKLVQQQTTPHQKATYNSTLCHRFKNKLFFMFPLSISTCTGYQTPLEIWCFGLCCMPDDSCSAVLRVLLGAPRATRAPHLVLHAALLNTHIVEVRTKTPTRCNVFLTQILWAYDDVKCVVRASLWR